MNTFLRYYISVPIACALIYLYAMTITDDVSKYIGYKSQFFVFPLLTYFALILMVHKFQLKRIAIKHLTFGSILVEAFVLYI
jgi:hypothetical protein